jgi:hypothetical protein
MDEATLGAESRMSKRVPVVQITIPIFSTFTHLTPYFHFKKHNLTNHQSKGHKWERVFKLIRN